MADVSHELGALRFVVDSPLSSKVAMFNNQVQSHQQQQLLNPFSNASGRASPKPTFSKDEYGKPLAGSLTEMRGQKANMHVLKEMLELCQIIDSEGYSVNDEPNMRVIPFGELFNIYNYISDKVVGILLRARKHKLVDFEGEMLFQRRDDDVPIFLLKPIAEIRAETESKIEEIKRGASPAPQATTLLLDKGAHQQKLQESALATPKKSHSRTPSPANRTASAPVSKASSPAPVQRPPTPPKVTKKPPTPEAAPTPVEGTAIAVAAQSQPEPHSMQDQIQTTALSEVNNAVVLAVQAAQTLLKEATPTESNTETPAQLHDGTENNKNDINNNKANNSDANELPTIVVDATGVHAPSAETAAEAPNAAN